MNDLWDNQEPITDLDITVPRWIDQDITPCDVASIMQGGCASGAYMPAVTYHKALATMTEHGDDIFAYLEDGLGELPDTANCTSWPGLACFYVSCAVEMWAHSVESEIDTAIEGVA